MSLATFSDFSEEEAWDGGIYSQLTSEERISPCDSELSISTAI